MKKSQTLLIISTLVLALASTTLCTIEPRGPFADVYITQGTPVFAHLSEGFSLGDIDWPLKIDVTPAGTAYTHETPFHQEPITGIADIRFARVFDNNKLALFQKSKHLITVYKFNGEKFDDQVVMFTPSFFNKRADFACEDTVFDAHADIFVVACRAPKVDDENPAYLQVFAFDTDGKEEPLTDFPIKNRIELKLFRDDDNSKSNEFQILLVDTMYENGVDVAIENKMRVYKVVDKTILPLGTVTLSDSDNKVGNVMEWHDFRNDIVVSSKRTDGEGKICFTLLKFDIANLNLIATDTYHCTKISAGTILISPGDEVAAYDSESKVLTIYRTKLDFKSPIWIEEDASVDYPLASVNPQGAMSEIYTNSVGFVFTFSTGQGVDESGNSYAYLKDFRYPYALGEGVVGEMINTNLFTFTTDKLSIYFINEPFIHFKAHEFDTTGKKQITISVTDKTTTTAVTSKLTIDVVGSPYGKMTLRPGTEDSRKNTQIFPGGVYKHIFDYSEIQYGNDPAFKLTYEDDVEGLIAHAESYVDHSIEYSIKLDGMKIIDYNAVEGGAMFEDEKTNTAYWFQCLPGGEYETECTKIIDHKLFGRKLGRKMGAALETIFSVEYNSEKDFSYFTWVELSGEWNYEHYRGRILDVDLVHSASGKLYSVLTFKDRNCHNRPKRFKSIRFLSSCDLHS